MQKRKLGIILRELMDLKYGSDNVMRIRECLNDIGFKKMNLPKYVKKKLIDHWVKDKMNDDIMKPYSYVIDPIDEIDILIKLEDSNYLAFTMVENRGHYPIYKKRINKEYIYVVVLEKREESIFYKGESILKDSNINSVLEFYHSMLEYKQVLDNELKDYKCEIQVYIKDKVASSFEYGRTGWCIKAVEEIYKNLYKKKIDFNNLLND